MKTRKALFPLILAGTVLFNSCTFIDLILDSPEVENKKTPTSSQSQNPNSYSSQNGNKSFSFKNVLPSETSLTFDNADNGKKLFAIYTNETKENLKHQRSASSTGSGMRIDKGITYMGHGIYRDEVHFDIPDQPIPVDARSARAAASYRDESDNEFYALFDSTQSYTDKKEFALKVKGKHCRIWFWNNNPSMVSNSILTKAEFQKLADNFDLIFEKEIQIFGSNIISNKYSNLISASEDTKIDILVYDLFGDATEDQTTGTLGFFYTADLFTNYKGNKCEAIHVDSYFLQYDIKGSENEDGDIVQTNMTTSTIVHEFQHLLNYCQKGDVSHWYNEMLSMCAEDIFEDLLGLKEKDTAKSRFYQGFNTPWQGFYNWPEDDKTEEGHNKVLHAYANAYAFGAYLMRNYGGVELIHNICTNKNTNEETSITDALQATGYASDDFSSVLQKFGSVYILNTAGITLNKQVTSNFYGVKYTLSPINLETYYFLVNERDFNFTKYYYLQGETSKGTRKREGIEEDVTALYGPGIFKPNSGYTFDQIIQSYGFVVYYLGTIDSSKTYSVANIKKQTVNNENLTMSVVVID